MANGDRIWRDDDASLSLVARALESSEYDLFARAWSWWHGQAPPTRRIDADFGAYIRGDVIPAYVRQFLRAYLDRHPEIVHGHLAEMRAALRARWISLTVIALLVLTALLVGGSG